MYCIVIVIITAAVYSICISYMIIFLCFPWLYCLWLYKYSADVVCEWKLWAFILFARKIFLKSMNVRAIKRYRKYWKTFDLSDNEIQNNVTQKFYFGHKSCIHQKGRKIQYGNTIMPYQLLTQTFDVIYVSKFNLHK